MRATIGERWFNGCTHLFMILLSVAFIIPIISIVSISLSSDENIAQFGYRLLPVEVDLEAYRFIFSTPMTLFNAYKVTIIMSAAGTFISLFMISTCAYALSRRDFIYRRIITFYLFFTMLFSGGLVPFYILMTNYLHLQDTYAALIIPVLGNVWYVFLMRTFFQQLPEALAESATIDGAGELRIYTSIILPLSKPVLATIGLMQLLTYWNSWYPALLFVSQKDMYPLQYLLQVMLQNISEITKNMQDNVMVDLSAAANLPTENMRMAMCILAIGPMLLVFPFVQKYFAKGLTVGSVKG
ncbi:putative aldouronate transport system permease protein [Paenibacillus sp. UNCCL117]|uniref:carbohydrate ABC transporter permease n=1 Tax=unclassified Paenibacillus TaxID=185978 RepID=UPI000883D4AA|nr:MULTISPECIES: carbohydrate ABC transporter permease [unclassified Paenibacillus]SDC05346.1 putative aldouronate transport system permease protein [Paenibacillus sp. cl123]SFW37559.1 putative aldouronate transport system permease protein [Paenibacillus sp. UNCCL117]